MCDTGYCAFERINGGARAEAMAGAFTAGADDYNSIYYNPAGLSYLSAGEAGLFYTVPFGLKELGVKCIALSFPFKNYGLGITAQQLGGKLYNESLFGISMGFKVIERLSAGINLKLFHIGIEKYGTANFFGADIGMIYELKNGLKFGIFSKDINRPEIGKSKDKISRYNSFGISKKLAPGLTLNIDINKYENYPLILKCGAEMNFSGRFMLRLGVSDNPARFCGGFGIKFKKLGVNYSAVNHSILGLTNQFSITLDLK